MTADEVDRPCVEIEYLLGTRKSFTIEEYEEGIQRARSLSSPKARAFHEVRWAEEAPPIEKLTVEWQKPGSERFRISDPDAFHAQMRKVLGLDEI